MNILKCIYAPPLWLLIINRLGWGLGAILMIIVLVEIVGQIAIKDKVFTKNIKILLMIMIILLLIGLASTAYLHYHGANYSRLLDC